MFPGAPASACAKAMAASSIERQRDMSPTVGTRFTHARRMPNSSRWSLRSIQLGAVPVTFGRPGSRLPVISPMPRKVITIFSASCEASMRSSRSMSGTIRNIVASESVPVTAAAVTCRW